MSFNMVSAMALVLVVCLFVAFVLLLLNCVFETMRKRKLGDVEATCSRQFGEMTGFQNDDSGIPATMLSDSNSSVLLPTAPCAYSNSDTESVNGGPPTYHTAVAEALAKQLRDSIRKYSDNSDEQNKILDRFQQTLTKSMERDLESNN